MKKIFLFLFFGLYAVIVSAQDPYYFGNNAKFNPEIPTPEKFFGFKIGSSLVRYDKVVEYFKLLADKSDRASIEVIGLTNQNREQIKLIVSSEQNQEKLEEIRKSHLKLIDPQASVNYANEKVIVEFAYNVHGGEIAGTDAAVLTAYYLVASEDPEITKRLTQAVVLIEPAQNPDGRERAVNFINGFQNNPAISDPNDIGHTGGWTPHRGNQYWNDLNRDWLALSQIESQNRVAYYHKWYPNIYLDFHEMGSSSTYYFEPSPLSSWNKILPQSNYNVLTAILAKHFSQALDKIGSLYFTKESFTNLSPIYGSTYPDYQGGVGITLEVGSTSGVSIETDAGIRTFSKNLRDNFEIAIAALKASTDEKETFLKEQKSYFESALKQAETLAYKSIVFGAKNDQSLNRLFLEHVLKHNIEVYELTKPINQNGKTYEPGSAYVIPLKQPHFRVIQSIFEENETNKYDKETTFYDISGWSTAQGYGIPYYKSATAIVTGNRIQQLPPLKEGQLEQAQLAYVIDYQDILAPAALYRIQANGIKPRVAHLPFTSNSSKGNHAFSSGSIIIPVGYQDKAPNEVYQILQEIVKEFGLSIYAVNNGFSVDGIDLGSNNIKVVKKPEIALISGSNWTSFGEIWSLFNDFYKIPVTKLRNDNLERVDLSRYTSIIITGSNYSEAFAAKLTSWIENGGNLISLSSANAWTYKYIFPTQSPKQEEGGRGRTGTPAESNASNFASRFPGVIVKATLDLKSTLAFGISDSSRFSLKTSLSGLDSTKIEKAILKSTDILNNGYAENQALARIKGNIIVGTSNKGRGTVVFFAESPAFRNYWYSSSRLLVNSIFFGAGSAQRRF